MAQKLRALETFPQDLSSVPSTLPGSSQLSVTPTWEEWGVLCLVSVAPTLTLYPMYTQSHT